MKTKYILILVILFFLFNCSKKDKSHYVPFTMENYVTDASPLIGDVIEYHLKIKHLENIEVIIPELDPLFEQLEIRDSKKSESVEKPYIIRNIVYSITTLSDSSFIIPSVTIKYKYEDEFVEIPTQEIYINFLAPDADLTGDIKDISDIMWLKYNYLLLIIIIFITAGLIISGIILYKKYFKKENIIISESEKYTPIEWAKIRLKKLSEKKYIENNFIKAYFFELTEIFKEFSEKVFKRNIPEMTTDEILTYLNNSNNKNYDEIKEYLNITDLVKYAKYHPPKAEINEIYKKTDLLMEKINNENLITKLAE